MAATATIVQQYTVAAAAASSVHWIVNCRVDHHSPSQYAQKFRKIGKEKKSKWRPYVLDVTGKLILNPGYGRSNELSSVKYR